MRRHFGEWRGVLKGCLGLAAFCVAMGSAPLYGQRTSFDLEGMVRRLAAIEEKDPYRLRQLVREGRPTLIAFIDHLCNVCLRSVEPMQGLRRRFRGRANVVIIDPARISVAHTWAKDTYRVWYVPKFVLVDKLGVVAREHFGPTSARTLTSELQALLAP